MRTVLAGGDLECLRVIEWGEGPYRGYVCLGQFHNLEVIFVWKKMGPIKPAGLESKLSLVV